MPLRADRDAALARAFADAMEAPTHQRAWRAGWRLPQNPGRAKTWPPHELAAWPEFRDAAAWAARSIPNWPAARWRCFRCRRVEALSGGLGALGEDFTQAAEAAGVEIRLGQEAVEVVIAEARAAGVALADGGRVMAGAVISTLDLKQSTLSLFAWSTLPAQMLEQARNWRMAGAKCAAAVGAQAAAAPRQAVIPGGRR